MELILPMITAQTQLVSSYGFHACLRATMAEAVEDMEVGQTRT